MNVATKWKEATFDGYYRNDGQVGTANFWIFIPLVFCQNRNLLVLKEAFETELGYKKENHHKVKLRNLMTGKIVRVMSQKESLLPNDGFQILME